MTARTTRLASIPAAAAALLLLGTASSCDQDPQHFWMVFDPCDPLVLVPQGASPAQLDSIERGIELWKDVADVRVGLSGPADARRLPIELVETEWYMGHFDDQAGKIEIATRVTDPAAFAVVLAHELGHAFGLYHVEPDERVSVMNTGNVSTPPLEGDIEVLEHMWGSCIRGQITVPPTESLRP